MFAELGARVLVICCGAKRSGSSLSYVYTSTFADLCECGQALGFQNIVSLDLDVVVSSSMPSSRLEILKTHDLIGSWSVMSDVVKLIYTHRDPEELVRSGIAKFSWDLSLARRNLLDYCRDMEVIRPSDNILIINYDDILSNPQKELLRMADFLNLTLSENDIMGIIEGHKVPQALRTAQLAKVSAKRRILQLLSYLKLRNLARALFVPDRVLKRTALFLNSVNPNTLIHEDHNTGARKFTAKVEDILSELSEEVAHAQQIRRAKFLDD